jgi:hypothetical protein
MQSILFLGDLSIGSKMKSIDLLDFPYADRLVVNLEGAFYFKNDYRISHKRSFYNSESTLAFLKLNGFSHVNLLNNHILDLGSKFLDETIRILNKENISYLNYDRLSINTISDDFGVLSLGSRLINCPSSWPNIENDNIVLRIRDLVNDSICKSIIIYVHCGFEFEKHPEPWLRNRLHDLAGIEKITHIICMHSHVIKGYEIVGDCQIFYGLGNLYIEDGHFFDGKLTYSQECNKGLGILINANKTILYSTSKSDNTVSFTKMEKDDLINYELIEDYPKFYTDNRRSYRLMIMPPNILRGILGKLYVLFIEVRFAIIKALIPLIK